MTSLVSLLFFLIELNIPNFSLHLFVYFFKNIIMTGEPMHTASKERIAPELMISSEHVPQLSNTASKVQWPLRFAFSYVQHVTQCYKQKTGLESPLQSIQSPWKIQTIHVYKPSVGKPCIVLLRIYTLDYQQKEMGQHQRHQIHLNFHY